MFKGSLVVAAALACVGTAMAWGVPPGPGTRKLSDPVPPVMDSAFTMDWHIYHVEEDIMPPYHDPPQYPYKQGSGTTYYDWTNGKKMMEVYNDYCVNIFPNDDYRGPCIFLNVNLTTYLINGTALDPKSCCLFADPPFHPPEPHFLTLMKYNGTSTLRGETVEWWVMTDAGEAGPFGYAVSQPTPGRGIPEAFFFRALPGWDSQHFFNYRPGSPSSSVWKVPAVCEGKIPNCEVHV